MDLAVEAGDIRKVYLHVSEDNMSAISFYKHRGFAIASKEKDYYINLPTKDAYVMEAELSSNTAKKTGVEETSFDATKHNIALNV